MAFGSSNSSPQEGAGDRAPESSRTPTTDVRTMLPKNGEVLNGMRKMRTKISGIFAAVNEPKDNG
ncbi:hypothetical protein IT413_02820 [Candidatus Peregrinibacteria bacterium]|nr:hypothetical protein [Candidatus Peregrinibacteria bacterium]